MERFTAIRNGILEHINAGKLCPFDFGIYVYMLLRADWSTGIFHGCALGISHGFNDPSMKHHINKAMIRLRERGFINYRKGDGRRGGYDVLIHKYYVTVGELSGHRLNAWKHGDLCQPEYERWNGDGTVEEEPRKSEGRVEEPSQDLLDVKDVKMRERRNFVAPTLAEVTAYCMERGNLVDPGRWFDWHLANGWRVGRNPMKNWKAAVRTWEKNGGAYGHANGNGKATLAEVVARETAILRSHAD